MHAQADRLGAQLAAAQRGLEAARGAEASARAQAAAEEKLRVTAKAEGEAQVANLKSEQAAEVARLNAARKKAEVLASARVGSSACASQTLLVLAGCPSLHVFLDHFGSHSAGEVYFMNSASSDCHLCAFDAEMQQTLSCMHVSGVHACMAVLAYPSSCMHRHTLGQLICRYA